MGSTMFRKLRFLVLLVLFVFAESTAPTVLYANENTVTVSGIVQDGDGNPLDGASVMIDSNWIPALYFMPGAIEIGEQLFTFEDSELGITQTPDGENLYFAFPSGDALITTTDADGAFEFTDVPVGAYWVFADADAYIDVREGPLLIEGDTTDIELTLNPIPEDSLCYPEGETVAVEGSVIDAVSGEPVSGATIVLLVCEQLEELESPESESGTDDLYMVPVHPVAAAVSDEEGYFTINVIPLEEIGYRLFLGAEGYVLRQANRFVKLIDEAIVVEERDSVFDTNFPSDFVFELTPSGTESEEE